MAEYRNFRIECTILPDAAGQYEAAFSIENTEPGAKSILGDRAGFKFPPVGSYLTPEDARDQTELWARKWIDANH